MCYTLVLTVMVICINVYPCAARPHESYDTNTISDKSQDSSKFHYKLPTVMTAGMIIVIKGTLNTNHETFNAKLPLNNPDSTDPHCELIYNFKTQKMETIPASSPDNNADYQMDIAPGTIAPFELELRVRNIDGIHIIDFSFNGDSHGPSEALVCKIQSYTDIDHIILNGVEHIESLMFVLPK